ncbi:hypothetical protein ASPZODRAFT_130905 [Penicilliopsis zonata CBS 506.65]|uniref:WW domain-containing protein n=1 Tax=Penicilliopsis zonata CBS 506.65 TaxID=1073090 RepID=A0A1L9SJN0_9EURO|nr:hypothetical protein ASPZODRAFT_130905 [Penicilliopsis zonata CBS 506.65]OJJ47442.1 hypothetical protein ASPZODRAFT_130905 [Penicilliopsis zonata CBS 506.65]
MSRQAIPNGELFLNSGAAEQQQPESPTIVEPLRIAKRDPASPPSPPRLPYPDDRQASSTSPSAALQTARPPVITTLAERRGGNAPKPLPESSPEQQQQQQQQQYQQQYQRQYQQQHYWPPPQAASNQGTGSISRLSSTASTSTTRAQRGSPPPPETPVAGPDQQPGSDIEARYAAAGIAGTSTLQNLQAPSAAAQRRAEPYAGQAAVRRAQQQQPVARPWTPTEQPGTQPHGPPTVYQGPNVVQSGGQAPGGQATASLVTAPAAATAAAIAAASAAPTSQPQTRIPQNALEQDFERMRVSSSPPPAYSTVPGASVSQGYTNEKRHPAVAGGVLQQQQSSIPGPHPTEAIGMAAAAPNPAPASTTAAVPSADAAATAAAQGHPAFANDPRDQQQPGNPSTAGGYQQNEQQAYQQQAAVNVNNSNNRTSPSSTTPTNGIPPASPPPLPEGWIAHLDQTSGQYYYIHLPTQSTQWEFPKGPTPLNLNDTPVSPGGSVFSAHPLTSPGLSSAFGNPLASPGIPMTPGYESLQSPSLASAFSGPPPSSGVDLYKVVPTNGVYFGPYLRYTNMDLERGIWLGSILLVTDAGQPPTIHIHQSADLSPNPRQLKAMRIAMHQRWTFYKYEIDLRMEESGPAKWTYAITSHLGCTRYEFLVAGRHETSWRFTAISGNDFGLNANATERARLGGVGFMWKDIIQKHGEIGGFHAQLSLGGLIYADRMWKEIPSLKQWLATRGKDARRNTPWTAVHEEDVSHAYFHYYTSHFDQPYLRECFAQIPYICQVDDHDIFDGFGSYPEHMQFSNMFKNIGRIGIEMYLLFQHHTTLDILRGVSSDVDLFTITGTGWHFVKYLGPAVAVVGLDCRSERNQHQVLAGPTYQGLFPKIAMLPRSVQHCMLMISMPLIYPRLDSAQQLANTVATGKRAVTGAYNVLGKVTSSVAGVVGAKDMVGSGFDSVKRAVGKSGLMGGILNPFGELDLLDELRDQWTHESKDLERTYLIRTLQGIAHQRSIRMTFLSGAVNVCGAGLVHDPTHPSDHKTMYQLISSAVVNTPPPGYIIKLLHSHNKPLYVPANGQRSNSSKPSDTKEDMMEIFQTDVTGQPRDHRKLMGRRNYIAIVAYDPDVVTGTYGQPDMAPGAGKLSLAVDFMVQGEGAYGNVVKYGPVIVPALAQGK